MKQRSIKTIFICFLLPLFSDRAAAQADSAQLESLNLGELLNVKVVTATKVSQALEKAPASVLVVTKEQIKLRGYQSLLDVLYDLPDVKVDDKIYPGSRNSITIRGTQGSEKFIILLDGVAISSPSGEALPIMENYPVHLAEQIEVVVGAASALYGANAVSGVINIITKKIGYKNLGVEASSSGGQYGSSNSTVLLTKQLGEKSGFILSGQYFYDKGVDYSRVYKDDPQYNIASYSAGTLQTIYGPMTSPIPIRAAYEAPMQAYNVYGALHLDDFSFSVFRNFTKTPSAYSNNTNNSVYNKDAYIAQSVTTASASYKKSFRRLGSSTTLVISDYTLHPGSNYRNLYTGLERAYKYGTTTMLKLDQQLDYHPTSKVAISAGAAYEAYIAIPQSADLQQPVDPKTAVQGTYLGTAAYYMPQGIPAQFFYLRYYNSSSYVQLQQAASKRLQLTLGTRYDYNSRYGTTINPRVGLVYQPGTRTTIKLLYGTAFLAPTASDAYAQWGSFTAVDSGRSYTSSFLHLPNPTLKPITSRNAELSVRQNLSNNFVISVSAYYSSLKGLHEFANDNETTRLYNNRVFGVIPVDYVEVFINNNRQKNYGGNLQLNGKFIARKATVNAYASVSYVNGSFETGLTEKNQTITDKELDFIAHFMVRTGLDVKAKKFSVSPRLLLMAKQHVAGIEDSTGMRMERQYLPGYALLNVALRYQAGKKVSVFATINNTLNQHYRAVGYNMDLKKPDTELFLGQRQDPLRVSGGVSVVF